MSDIKAPYELHMNEENIEFHSDLDIDMIFKKEGIFSFVIKINDGHVVDYTVLEYAEMVNK